MASGVTCIECGVELNEERAELGYQYCTKEACQARHHRGVVVTAIGVNKSAETFIVADQDEIRRRGEAGEFAKKDSALGVDYRAAPTAPACPGRAPAGSERAPDRPHRARAQVARVPSQRGSAARRPWTAEQEKIVRLYHDMGLSPREIAQRARGNVPRLMITERLTIQILSSGRR